MKSFTFYLFLWGYYILYLLFKILFFSAHLRVSDPGCNTPIPRKHTHLATENTLDWAESSPQGNAYPMNRSSVAAFHLAHGHRPSTIDHPPSTIHHLLSTI